MKTQTAYFVSILPKGQDITDLRDEHLQTKVSDLNHRPKKYLDYKTPAEIYFSTLLHFA